MFYYLNVTTLKDNNDYINQINEKLKLEDNKITNIPTIIYYEEGHVKDIIKYDENTQMSVSYFEKMLDQNKISN